MISRVNRAETRGVYLFIASKMVRISIDDTMFGQRGAGWVQRENGI